MEERRRIVSAANRIVSTGLIVPGARHFDIGMNKLFEALGASRLFGDSEQGFIDQWGHFFTREEAFKIATESNQIIEKTGGKDSKQLFSEDLY